MKLAIGGIWWSLRLVAASGVTVYLHDRPNDSISSVQSKLSSFAARCVLAQRSNALDYHVADLSGADAKEVIQAINDYGVSTSLIGTSRQDQRATVLFETSDANSDVLSFFSHQGSFTLDPFPSTSAIYDLINDIDTQAKHHSTRYVSSQQHALSTGSLNTISVPEHEVHVAKTFDDLKRLFNGFRSEEVHVTTILISSTNGTANFDWGTYTMPDSYPLLNKRDHNENPPESRLRRQESSENSSLSGILPLCFASQSDCQTATRNCTGHGLCRLKYSDKSTNPAHSCFACECTVSKTTNANGQLKTTYWGGPACQKRDVSTAFWLIALFSIGMVFLVGFAVGQIWTMGEQELPSVIGAGVSGPVKRS